MFRVLIFAGMMLAGGVLAVRYVDQNGRAPSAMAMQPAPQPSNSRTMVIRAGDGGHFQVDARIDGRRLGFVVVPDEALSVNLLGMSFLSRVRWSHERGQLVLEQ